MKYYILASVIIFGLVIHHAIRRNTKLDKDSAEKFWERESRANSVRKKSIENLPYITIPFSELPVDVMNDNPTVKECIHTLETLSERKILNLTGYSNTDLKLEYGTANITPLSEYDQNYTVLVRTLQKWADELWKADYKKEASVILEFALTTFTDVSSTYYRLAEYYKIQNEPEKIEGLIVMADMLHSSQKNIIVRTLKESYL